MSSSVPPPPSPSPPPVERVGDGSFRLNLGPDERAVVLRMLAELRSLLRDDHTDASAATLLVRLFPPVYPDDEAKEAEYQRLMRDELVRSRLAQIDHIAQLLQDDDGVDLDTDRLVALMQSVNALRLVLGTMLDVGEDDDIDTIDEADLTPEHHLYGYLSWLLDWTVRALD